MWIFRKTSVPRIVSLQIGTQVLRTFDMEFDSSDTDVGELVSSDDTD